MKSKQNKTCPVSVIMPVYNYEKYVAESIQSILNQTYSDFEFIIVDDCSNDNTWDIIQSFSDDRIIAVRNGKNNGNYPSRNRGMKKAGGKYIAVMDGDDIALPDRLWKQYDYLEKHADVLALGTQFDFTGIDYKRRTPVTYEKIRAALLDNNYFLHPSLMIRSAIMKQLNGYDEKYIFSSDYDLACRLSMLGKVENLPDTCMLYRWHPDQITQKNALRQRMYADDIRQRYQIAFINKYKDPKLPDISEAETGYPDIGRIIGLYIMGKCIDDSFREEADNLLSFTFDNANTSIPLCIKRGLLGLSMGMIYLLRNNFVEGDEDEVLEDIDIAVFNSISDIKENQSFEREDILCYLRKRALISNRNISTQQKIKEAILKLES